MDISKIIDDLERLKEEYHNTTCHLCNTVEEVGFIDTFYAVYEIDLKEILKDYEKDFVTMLNFIEESLTKDNRDKFACYHEYFKRVYIENDYNIKRTLEALEKRNIQVCDKQLRNILKKLGIYKGRKKNDD